MYNYAETSDARLQREMPGRIPAGKDSMKPKVYIDGQAGTTGLEIASRLNAREDITLLVIEEALRKDDGARAALMNEADLVFLCLPDQAATDAVGLVTNPETRIVDASTAHRTAPGWTYGLPELGNGAREAVARSKRTANPGCHATGFISVVYPLVKEGILSPDAALSCFSITGFSGGGKKMIAQYGSPERGQDASGAPDPLCAPGIYGLTQAHKHLPEMQAVCGLSAPPVFSPVVCDFPRGMATTVPLLTEELSGIGSADALLAFYREYYADAAMITADKETASGTLYANAMAGRDSLRIVVAGGDERVTVTALFDNLGKGASGAAVQNMNLMLGLPETAGLTP